MDNYDSYLSQEDLFELYVSIIGYSEGNDEKH